MNSLFYLNLKTFPNLFNLCKLDKRLTSDEHCALFTNSSATLDTAKRSPIRKQ